MGAHTPGYLISHRGGMCRWISGGVGVVPVKPARRDILLHDLVHVEAIPYEVMQAGHQTSAQPRKNAALENA